ncbi:hypothetical protein [Streptomyces sp. NPDC002209]|uniref:hypothetical protein n=1 Tax=Streptomyces sp. NPDC002209 TaxID=3364638 RepID=UPI0036CB15C1
MVLRDHEVPISAGFTPLTIETPTCRAHLVEVYIVGYPGLVQPDDSQAPTDTADVYDLNPTERLVVTVLAQRYLRQEPYPQPVSWQQVAQDLNRVAAYRPWNDKTAERTIANLRQRLANGPNPIRGVLRGEVGEPVGNTLNKNLIEALLKSATLIPEDLHTLGEEL